MQRMPLDILQRDASMVHVDDPKVLDEIQRLAQLDRIVLTRHAVKRMDQRGAKRGDVARRSSRRPP